MKLLRLPVCVVFPDPYVPAIAFAAFLVSSRDVSFGTSRSENLCYDFPNGVRAWHGPAKESTGATRPPALSELLHHYEMVPLAAGARQAEETVAHLFVCPNCKRAQRSDAKFTAIRVPDAKLASPQLRVVRGGR